MLQLFPLLNVTLIHSVSLRAYHVSDTCHVEALIFTKLNSVLAFSIVFSNKEGRTLLDANLLSIFTKSTLKKSILMVLSSSKVPFWLKDLVKV